MPKTLPVVRGRIHTAPEKLGLDPHRLQELERHFAGLIERGKLQGASYLVARDGEIAVNNAIGSLTYHEDSAELQPDSIRKVFSITKAFTAVAIAKLVEEGKLFYQQPVSAWLPEFDTVLHRDITIQHLLSHTSGLMADPGCRNEPYQIPWYEWWVHEKQERDPSGRLQEGDWIRTILGGRMWCKPGEQWSYSTAGYSLLGEVISRASGQHYDRYIQEQIITPLGLDRTFMNSVPQSLHPEVCYVNPWQEKEFRPAHDGTGTPPAAGNGLFSTLEDLWKFGQCLLDGGSFNGHTLLGRRMVQNMVSNQLKNIPSTCWGEKMQDYPMSLGFNLNHNDICSPGTFSHEGFGHSGLYVDPRERLVYVFFVPSQAGWVPEAVINPRAIVWSALL
ncbi:serine hydrolase domain-containing protein [Fontibacillus sp. BL9]|uniref:serine hydrolase domain-containing protein n=1 Tax=Fontibacillus sp. BL9 TaxID=3389971 RepID=UPI00397AA1DB